jgi:tRNA/tmRNA/rRNA uracil-C5-methylase (TrmA/RlmC/RlmD family)
MSDDLKMCIIGLEKYWDDRQLKKVFEGRNIEFKYLNKRKGHSVGFVTFENVEQKKKNIPMISQIKGFKGRSLLVDNLTHKSKKSSGRRKRNDYDEKGLKRQKVDTSNKTAKDAVTPNWHISYDEQLLAKEDKLVKSLKNFRRRTRKDIFRAHGGNKARVSVNWENFPRWLRPAGGFAGNLSWLSQQEKQNNNKNDSSSSSSSSSSTTTQTKEEGGATSSEASKESIPTHGLPCPIEKIVGMTNDGIPSQCGRYRYRNKCEFTVGNNKNGELCLGFRVSTFGDTIKVESPSECDNIPQAAKNLCARFELFLKGSSLPMYDVLTHDGVYRQLTVQCSGRTNDLRGMVQVKLEGIDNDVWEKELARLSTWCDENNIDNTTNKGLGLTGMLVQRYDGPSMPVENDPLAVPKLLWGKPDLEEHLTVPSSDTETPPTLKFLVSPGAFFQVNTPGCDLLYSIVGRFAKSSIEDLQMPTVLSAIEKQIKAEQGGDEDDDVEMTDTNDTTTTTSTISIKNGSFKSDNSDITVLDVCCGTGTIGLCVAASNEKVKKVVGVELCEAAVLDAKRNAKLNNQGDTAHFFAAKAEAM